MSIELGALGHWGHRVKQPVTGWPGVSVLYLLCPDDRVGAMVQAFRNSAPLSIYGQARAFAQRNRSELLAMLHAAQTGNFKAANHGVSWTYTDPSDSRVCASAFFLAWDNPRPVMMYATDMDLEVARARAVDEFLALSEATRRGLFDVAARGA